MPVLRSAISIEIIGGLVLPLLGRNAQLPTRANIPLLPRDKQQNQMEIHIVYGENAIASDNLTLARFMFDGLSSRGKSKPIVNIKLAVDKKMLLNFTVKDRSTGLRHDVKDIDLSHVKPPPIITPLPKINLSNSAFFGGFFSGFFDSHFCIGPKTEDVDELAKVILRLLAPDSIHMFLTNPDDMLDKYDLSSQQRHALELISAEMVGQLPFPTLYVKVKHAVEYLEEHPDAVLCPTCSGTGLAQRVQQGLLGNSITIDDCHTCSGIGLIQS